jgi:hypothetical protein
VRTQLLFITPCLGVRGSAAQLFLGGYASQSIRLHNWRPLVSRAVDEQAGVVRCNPALTFQHPYPPTKVAFIPDKVRHKPGS